MTSPGATSAYTNNGHLATKVTSAGSNYDSGLPLRYEAFGEMARAAAAGTFRIPIARALPLEQWREAMEMSVSGKARGKLLRVPTRP